MKLRCFAVGLVLLLVLGVPGLAETVDYGNAGNWAYWADGDDQPVDVFLVCPTVDMGKSGGYNMAMDDDDIKEKFAGALNMEKGIYAGSGVMYAPYYRQATFPVYQLSESEAAPYFDIAYQDVRAAFLTFAESTDERPFILAGFSQGSDMVLRLMREFFADDMYSDRLVAAYCIGWRLTQEDTDAYPHMVPAQSADDTGCIVIFNSEAPDVTDSLMVPEGVKTYCINPLNWKTDETPADAESNMGACFTDYSGSIVNEIPKLTGAYIDPARGTLKLPDIVASDYSNSLFPDGVYHLYDYQFFYRNLQSNVAIRATAYLSTHSLSDAA